MLLPILSWGQPTYALLGYAPQPRPEGVANDDDVYSLAEHGALSAEPVVPAPMRYRDIPAAFDSMEQAIAADPLDIYMTDTPDGHKRTRRWRLGRAVSFLLALVLNIYLGRMWTIRHGESVVALIDPTAAPPPGGRLLARAAATTLRAVRALTESPEQRTRSAEFGAKYGAAAEAVLGPELARVVELGSLATRPDRQGRGYASALVRTVTARADALGVRTFLGSSNVANRGFYASLGFRIVCTIPVGVENPTWHGKPILVDLMVREVGGGKSEEICGEKLQETGTKDAVLVVLG